MADVSVERLKEIDAGGQRPATPYEAEMIAGRLLAILEAAAVVPTPEDLVATLLLDTDDIEIIARFAAALRARDEAAAARLVQAEQRAAEAEKERDEAREKMERMAEEVAGAKAAQGLDLQRYGEWATSEFGRRAWQSGETYEQWQARVATDAGAEQDKALIEAWRASFGELTAVLFLDAKAHQPIGWKDCIKEATALKARLAAVEKLLGWVVENQELAMDDARDCFRQDWPVGDNRAARIREWDRKMEEAAALVGTAPATEAGQASAGSGARGEVPHVSGRPCSCAACLESP